MEIVHNGVELIVLLPAIITLMESMDHVEHPNQHPNVSSNVMKDQISHILLIKSREYRVTLFPMTKLKFNKKSSVMDQSK